MGRNRCICCEIPHMHGLYVVLEYKFEMQIRNPILTNFHTPVI